MASAASPSLNPKLRPGDPETARWLAQVTLRLRRELTWLRRDGELAGSAQDALDLTRFHDQKLAFFAQDATAKWLSERMSEAAKKPTSNSVWRRAASALNLDDAAQFVLACALAGRADAAFGPVAAAANGFAGFGTTPVGRTPGRAALCRWGPSSATQRPDRSAHRSRRT